MMKYPITMLLLVFFCHSSYGVTERSHKTSAMKIEWVQDVELKKDLIKKVYYGNSKIGFFESKTFTLSRNAINLRMIPPTYKDPVLFYGEKPNREIVPLGKKKFKSPLPRAFRALRIKRKGNLKTPYFLVSGGLPKSKYRRPNDGSLKPVLPFKNNGRFTFPMIVNKLGEIVWTYIPAKDGEPFNEYMITQQVSKGVYRFLFSKTDSHLTTVNWLGQAKNTVSVKQLRNGLPMHHDFVQAGPHRYYALGYSKHRYGTNKSYLASTIVELDSKQANMRVVKDFGEMFNAYKTKWDEDREDKTHFVHWNEPKADHDFTHANALVKTPSGFLISFRHLHKLVLMDHQFKRVKWTLGSEKRDSMQVKGRAKFSFQHTPFISKNNDLILFDNGLHSQKTRVLALSLKGKQPKFLWQFPKNPYFFSKNRGSVIPTKQNTMVAYFVSPKIKGKYPKKLSRTDLLIEFDPQTQKELGRLELSFIIKSPGYRGHPIYSLGLETPTNKAIFK